MFDIGFEEIPGILMLINIPHNCIEDLYLHQTLYSTEETFLLNVREITVLTNLSVILKKCFFDIVSG